ncbi:HAD family phosphatase [Butyrivibrio sp.]|uniref:HAD family hydrolase n=1 Tax=Butyrivibrio sp. TaxID=28121 RepID=UPI0025BDF3DE|nr:HAD family phosphatase [Butyrivibrio sp.]MBQ9301587.1 HAD family phosphatase [Butyrivibrio sp.]
MGTKIKAILFDMDGVLIDAKDWHYEALNKALGLFGMEISRYDHLHSFDGLPTREKLKMLSEEFYLPESLHSFINQMKQQYTMEIVNIKCRPLFEHEYALSKLKNQGYRMAVCSNSVRKTIETMMEKAELLEYFDFLVSNEDVKNAKPDPEIYTTAINKLKLLPEECLVLEDNKNGILAAKRSGANLLKVQDVHDVNYMNIMNRIKEVENG